MTCGNRSGPGSAGPEDGFTLVEVIAALAILALTLTVLFSTISEGSQRQRRARTAAEASLLAQSLLAKVGTEWPLRVGKSGGEFANGFRWYIEIASYGEGADAQHWSVGAYNVDVTVFGLTDAERPAAQLTTLRLGSGDRQ